jgi:DNA-directed RNA polymerase specialized sigma24 family protein
MSEAESTCWTIIQGAAAGNVPERELFAQRYAAVIRAYLSARWRSSPLQRELDDALQEVFVECFRQGGVLEKADRERPGGFRPFLYGVTRNVARRLESRSGAMRGAQPAVNLDNLASPEEALSRVFDRAWAQALLREAAEVQTRRAHALGQDALRRVELLRLRFHEGLPIRTIAERWQADPAKLHQAYLKARQEFKAALREVVAFHQPGRPEEIDRTCAELVSLL